MSSEEVRRAVAESWARRFDDYESRPRESPPKRTASEEVREAPVLKQQKRAAVSENEVIEILSDDEELPPTDDSSSEEPIEITSDVEEVEAEEKPQKKNQSKTKATPKQPPKKNQIPPPLLPIHNPLYDDPKLRNSIVVSDVLSSPNLKSCYIFSFQYDLNFVLSQIRRRDVDLTIVYQTGTIIDSPLRKYFRNLQLLEVKMEPFTTHHPKLIVNIYDDETVQLFLLSANMTETEWNTNNQMIWQSPLLYKGKDVRTTDFQTHLFDFFFFYNKPKIGTLVLFLRNYDFSTIKGDFVSSATSVSNKFGYWGLYKSLLSKGLIPKKHDKERQLLYQSSSIASAIRHTNSTNTSANIFTHLLLPLFSGKYTDRGILNISKEFPLPNGYDSIGQFTQEYKVKPYVIFPSLSDVRNSLYGYMSGGWSHFNPHSSWNKPIADFFKRHIFHHSFSNQRQTNSSHTKFLIMSSDNFQTLDWVFFTSSNMSKQAWGSPPTKQDPNLKQSHVSNYETGILLCPADYGPGFKFIPLEFGEDKDLEQDEVPIYLPFRLPPEQYSDDDEPWCISVPCGLPDIRGYKHSPS